MFHILMPVSRVLALPVLSLFFIHVPLSIPFNASHLGIGFPFLAVLFLFCVCFGIVTYFLVGNHTLFNWGL